MNTRFTKLYLSLALLFGTCCTHALYINQMVIFGDSSVDTGQLYEYTHYKVPSTPPYYKGRFSDGPLWIERLVKYYFPRETSQHLENYAFAGSGVLEKEVHLPLGAHLTLSSQLERYFFHHPKPNSKALYVFSIGAGNYFYHPKSKPEVVDEVITGVSHAVRELAAKGAPYIMLTNLPDLGKTPLARKLQQETNLSELSARHNEQLQAEFMRLQTAYPKTRWFMLDLYAISEEIYTYPGRYDIGNTFDACHEILGLVSLRNERDLSTWIESQSDLGSSKDCDAYLFFDMAHATKKVQAVIASKAADLLRWNV